MTLRVRRLKRIPPGGSAQKLDIDTGTGRFQSPTRGPSAFPDTKIHTLQGGLVRPCAFPTMKMHTLEGDQS